MVKWNMIIFQFVSQPKLDPDTPEPTGTFPPEIVSLRPTEILYTSTTETDVDRIITNSLTYVYVMMELK